MGMKSYRELNVWKKGIEVVKNTYKLTEKLPKQETYGLISQMKRSAVSIPSNIAEGFRRYHNKEYKQFLYVASGSCAELETLVTIARVLKYFGQDKEAVMLEKLDHIGRMISSLLKKL